MLDVNSLAFRLASALAIGLLIGAERERRKGEGPSRSPAGIRTFAIASLLGALSLKLLAHSGCLPLVPLQWLASVRSPIIDRAKMIPD